LEFLRYVTLLFSPVFDSISIHAGSSAKTFSVIVRNNTLPNEYIQSAKLNGKAYNHCFIYYRDIVNGSTPELVMGPERNKEWGRTNNSLD
jgi:putative alpha-1,2-mannosidase